MSTGGPEQEVATGRPLDRAAVVVQGDNRGIVSTGAFAFNVMYGDDGFAEIPNVMELPLREPPELPVAALEPLFGRDQVVAWAVEQIASGRSAQLYGESGVGKKAIARAVHRALASSGVRGHELLPQSSAEEYTLDGVYRRIATLFFGKNFLRSVDGSVLRAAFTASRARAHITLIDCPLRRDDVSRLLETFPHFTFLITSQYPTLPSNDHTHHVQPLARADAVDLLCDELDLPLGPVGLKNLQFDHAYQAAEGKPQRLRLYAAFIKSSDQWRARSTEEPFDRPASTDPDLVSPVEQAKVLAAAISEPARRVLVALWTVGAPLAPAWFAALTGVSQAAEAGRELYDRRLVTRDDDHYRITEDATAAINAFAWNRIDAKIAAEGILALIDEAQAPIADPDMLMSIAVGLDATQEWATATRFDKMAAPIALAAGRGKIALHLYALGKKAAARADLAEDLEYYVRTEDLTRRLLQGGAVTAAAALAVAAKQGTSTMNHAINAQSHVRKGIRATRWGNRLLRGKALVATVTVTTTVTAVTAVGIVAATGPDDNGIPPDCMYRAQIALNIGNMQLDWINLDGPEQIDPLVSQTEAQARAAAAAATDPQAKQAFEKEDSDVQAFGNAYTAAHNAGIDYGIAYQSATGQAVETALDTLVDDERQPGLQNVCA